MEEIWQRGDKIGKRDERSERRERGQREGRGKRWDEERADKGEGRERMDEGREGG